MPDWLVERGIGETRYVRIEDGEIAEARIRIDGAVPAGTVLTAKLKQATPAVAVADGQEYLLPKGARGTTQGAPLTIAVTRERIPGGEPWKRPLARLADGSEGEAEPDGQPFPLPSPDDPLEQAGWSDLLDEARSGTVRFAGGELLVSVTPAMTVIDVDGRLPPAELAIAGAHAAARVIRRHGIGGSIGIDFPTLGGKAQRQAVGEAIDAALPLPFERTAMNGFGFLQIIRPRRHASLFEIASDRAAFEARALLRRASRERAPLRLVAHPAVIAVIEGGAGWIEQLSRQAGGPAGLRADPKLAISAGYAEKE